LQGQAQGGGAGGIDAEADEAARHVAFERFGGGEKGGVWATEAHGHAKTLCGADDDVGAHFARRGEEGEPQQIGCNDSQRAGGVGGVDFGPQVAEFAGGARVLEKDGEGGSVRDRSHVARRKNFDVPAEGGSAGLQDGAGLRVQVGSGGDGAGFGAGQVSGHGDGFGGGGGFVEQGRVGDRQAGEVGDHGLVIQQGFKAALGDLGLVGGVGGVPAGVFEHVALDHRWGMGAMVAAADQAFDMKVVVGCEGGQFGENGRLVDGVRKIHFLVDSDAAGDGAGDEIVDGGGADGGQHLGAVCFVGADMAGDEGVLRLQCCQIMRRLHHL
jgi:hypothetical protein